MTLRTLSSTGVWSETIEKDLAHLNKVIFIAIRVFAFCGDFGDGLKLGFYRIQWAHIASKTSAKAMSGYLEDGK